MRQKNIETQQIIQQQKAAQKAAEKATANSRKNSRKKQQQQPKKSSKNRSEVAKTSKSTAEVAAKAAESSRWSQSVNSDRISKMRHRPGGYPFLAEAFRLTKKKLKQKIGNARLNEKKKKINFTEKRKMKMDRKKNCKWIEK